MDTPLPPLIPDVVIIVRCFLVEQRCSGYLCEMALNKREDGFADIPAEHPLRHIDISCGGCCGRAVQRKISNALKMLQKKEGIGRERVAVQLSSCMTRSNYHGPKCPNLGYIRKLISRLGIAIREDTHLSATAQRRRDEGLY